MHVVHVIDAHGMYALLGPQHHETAQYQGHGHGDRIEQVLVDHVGEDHPQHYRRQKRDEQIDGKALCIALRRQPRDDISDLAPKLPDDCQNCAELNDDVERHCPFAAKTNKVRNDNLVTGAGYRQELGQPFYNPQNYSLCGTP